VGDEELLRSLRNLWPTAVLVVRYGRNREQIAADIDVGLADIAPPGRIALANPDIVERLRSGAPLNEVDPSTLYGGEAPGYTDYHSGRSRGRRRRHGVDQQRRRVRVQPGHP